MRPTPIFCLLLTAALGSDSLASTPTSHWRDSWGLAATPALPASADTSPTALQLKQHGNTLQAWVEHGAYGSHVLRLSLRREGNRPALLAQRTLQQPGRYLLLELPSDAPHALTLQSIPGPSRQARGPARHVYALPIRLDQSVRVHQAAHGAASHHDVENRHAWDFALPAGSPVLAARAGRVMASHGSACCPTRVPGDGGNWVRIEHDDGSMAVYAHLQADSLAVRAGQQVTQGQLLGRSGNTGHSSAPHLHFAVQINDGQALRSIPVEMNGPQGRLRAASGSTAP